MQEAPSTGAYIVAALITAIPATIAAAAALWAAMHSRGLRVEMRAHVQREEAFQDWSASGGFRKPRRGEVLPWRDDTEPGGKDNPIGTEAQENV